MALIARGMYKLILRVNVVQEISQEGWRYILSEILPAISSNKRLGTPGFDGELLCVSSMGPMGQLSELLMSFGYRWTKDLDGSDFAWFDNELPKLDWLEEVEAEPLQPNLRTSSLWQLKGSKIGYFADHEGQVWWRGRDYNW